MKSKFLKIMSFVLALTMITMCFASCKKETTKKPEKPSNIVGPPVTQSKDDDDDIFSDSETTTEKETEEETEEIEFPSEDDEFSDITFPDSEPSTKPSGSSSHGMTNQDIINLVKVAGFEYDSEQKVFYSVMNPIQRHFGFSPIYDEAAPQTNMLYKTIKIDFKYKDLLWRIQCWKGQYGVLVGAEMGVYTKDPNSPKDEFFECADDEHLMQMRFGFYKTISDFNNRNMAFERKLQEHWWLTGFQFGHCSSRNCVLDMTIIAYDNEMADGIEEGLQKVKDADGYGNGFVKYEDRTQWTTDFYKRDGKQFRICWVRAGFDNHEEPKKQETNNKK